MGNIILSNGVKLNDICFGTGVSHTYDMTSMKDKCLYWTRNALKNKKRFKKDYHLSEVIDAAMKNNCNMFDTSRAYGGSEYVLGKTLKKYKRSDYIIITKVSNYDQYKGNIRPAIEKSLSELGTDYIDLYLLHWPVRDRYIESWKQLEKFLEEGICKSIGVCNCNIHHLKEIEANCNIAPMVNQFECHPLFTQNELREYCSSEKIQVMAYTSTGRMDERLFKTALTDIAKKHNKTVTQVILRWHQQIGNIPIVSSSNVKHMIENTMLNDFYLSDHEIAEIEKININSRLRYDPDNCDFTKL